MSRAGLLLLFGVLHIGCHSSATDPNGESHPDATAGGHGADAAPYPGDIQCVPQVVVSCQGSGASITTSRFAPSPMYICPPDQFPTVVAQASCTSGCSVSGALTYKIAYTQFVDVTTPSSLCAETPDVQIGDSCNSQESFCTPTRATLAADGTVVSESYLTCDSGSQRCVARPAPVIPNYLHACDAATVAQHDAQDMNGVVGVTVYPNDSCLLAWDDATQAITSGITRACIGDWECPEGSLCDDQITPFAGAPVAVCKPGPRGTLTPAMLSPS